ncbi:hypothetical protein QQF64_009059, partial [Cirrhinus molitorella]
MRPTGRRITRKADKLDDDDEEEEEEEPDLSSFQQKRSGPKPSRVSKRSSKSMGQPLNLNRENTKNHLSHKVLNTFRSNLLKKFKCLCEGIAKQGNSTLLNEIYTELYITESESGEISNEHE